ncbi:PAS domain-containing protein [Robiginitomaculum antarcticum]|uniref:PAS domain-containing protein n=1 Tax=Robiginitomaculum antarcticum TaxID=437507 RepID=UPI00037BFD00|nr:PAS domain-containing protein [Robiginitomaculum antarcticum]
MLSKLKAQNEHARQNVHIMVAEMGPDFKFTYANDAYATLYGMTPDEVIGKHPRDFMTDAIYAQVAPKLESSLSGQPFKYNLDLSSLKSGPRFVEVYYQPELSVDNLVSRIMIVIVDVTQQRLYTDMAETLDTRLKAAHQLSPDGFMVFESVRNSEGSIEDFIWQYSNDAGVIIAKHPLEDLIGSRYLDKFPASRAEGFFASYVNVVETGETFETVSYYNRDGLNLWIEVTAIKLGDGFAVSFSDVTKHKQQEMSLKENEARLNVALNAAKLGVWELDPVAKTSKRSARHDYIFGYPNGIENWSHETFLNHVVPEEQAHISEIMENALDNKDPWYIVTRINAADGLVKWVSINGEPIFDDHGDIDRLIGTIGDITADKNAEEHRELLVRELNHRVKNSLATIQAIAKQTMRSAENMENFETSFNARLRAISAAHEILMNSSSARADVAMMIDKQVRPYASETSQLTISGDTVSLSAESAHSLGLVLHELATNASKYGALSKDGGTVTIKTTDLGSNDVRIVWLEAGGPPVSTPTSTGFGSRLIKQSIEYSLEGSAELSYKPEGFEAVLVFPKNFDVK